MISPVHMIVAPILIPLVSGAIMLLYDERRRRLKQGIGLASCGLQLVVAIALILRAKDSGDAVSLYLQATGHRPMASSWCWTGCRR